MRNTVLYGILLAAVTAGCAGNDPTTLTTGLDNPSALLVNGSTLFWINDSGKADSSIQSMPITGGVVTTVLSQPNLDENLATDGTSLYFSSTAPSGDTSVIASCALDGDGMKTLNSNLELGARSENQMSNMYVQGGNVYVGATDSMAVCVFNCATSPLLAVNSTGPFVFSVPTGGGTETIAVPLPVTMNSDGTYKVEVLGNFYRADSTGIYYSAISENTNDTDQINAMYSQPIGGSSSATLWSVSVTASNLPPSNGGLVIVGTTAFFITDTIGASDVTLMSVPGAGGTATTVASYSDQSSAYITGDSSGLFIDQGVVANNGGFFSVTLSGVETSFVKSQLALSTSVGHERQMIVDSTNVYWVAGGFNPGQGTIHAKAR